MPDSIRIGHGYDIHRLQQGGELVLGGVVVAEGVSAVAHSDGDVVIHAIVDALLGALARGDIGEHFPDDEDAYHGAPSVHFLNKVFDDVKGAAYVIANVDVTILAERPKLQSFKPKMARFLQAALNCPVNIKAGTNEGCGEIGRGEAVAAHAVALLVRESDQSSGPSLTA